MFGHHYLGRKYWGPRYWGPGAAVVAGHTAVPASANLVLLTSAPSIAVVVGHTVAPASANLVLSTNAPSIIIRVPALSEPHYAVTKAFMDRLAEQWTNTAVLGLNGVTVAPGDGESFVVFEHERVSALKPSLTTRRFFQDGRAELRLHVPSGTGMSTGLALGDNLATLFRERAFGGVKTYTPSGPLIGDVNDEGNWLALRILVPYRYQFGQDALHVEDDTSFSMVPARANLVLSAAVPSVGLSSGSFLFSPATGDLVLSAASPSVGVSGSFALNSSRCQPCALPV